MWGGLYSFLLWFGIVWPADFEINTLTSRTPLDDQRGAVEGLIERTLQRRSKEFKVVIDPSLGPISRNTFKVTTNLSENVVTVYGNNGISASWGFHYYLTRYVGAHVSWDGQQLDLPKKWPRLPAAGISVTSNDKFRYMENVCTFSYSYPWYDWSSWEKHIDWMAMNAINLPLAIGGQEEIWRRVFLKFGFSSEDIQDYLTGPAFMAWNRMGNIKRWGGQTSLRWFEDQAKLQKKILERMRSFSMFPILPAFAGFVPDAVTDIFPGVKVHRMPRWNKFNASYSSNYLLDSHDPLFLKIGVAFLEEYAAEFGRDHMYSADTFNEMSEFGDPHIIASYGRAVYRAMRSVDEDAIWVMQGWIFQDSMFWTQTRAKSLLTSVPIGRMIVLDLYAEEQPRYSTYFSFYGQPFIWCMLHNFGGKSSFYGAVERVDEGPFAARNFNGSSMVGIGLAPEAINQNYVVYEFMLEHTWVKQRRDIDDWTDKYVRRRYSTQDPTLISAWQKLMRTVYNFTATNRLTSHCFTNRPNLHMRNTLWYNPDVVLEAWDSFLDHAETATHTSSLFKHDLVDISRQAMEIQLTNFYTNLTEAYRDKDVKKFAHFNDTLVTAMLDLDELLLTDRNFLAGLWFSSARRSAGDDPTQQALFEFNARNQLTVWGPNGNVLDYAVKQWSGLIERYCLARWMLFTSELVKHWGSFHQESFNKKVFREVELPFSYDETELPSVPRGDPVRRSRELHQKYRFLPRVHHPI